MLISSPCFPPSQSYMPDNPDLFQHLTPQMFDDERARFFKNPGNVPNDPKAITSVAGQGGWCQPSSFYCTPVPPVGSINDERVDLTQYTRTTLYPDQRRLCIWTDSSLAIVKGKEMTTYKACKAYQPSPPPSPLPPPSPVPEPVPVRQIAPGPHSNPSLSVLAIQDLRIHQLPHQDNLGTLPRMPYGTTPPLSLALTIKVIPRRIVIPGPPIQPSLHNLPQRPGKKRYTQAAPIQSRPP
ncbi:uncharacterized protein STEHIDRAFT_110377 [Stereum hirsutum FP-91666 SS1]|uniref:uncharacterized protein n=1 Tax=Stereum hirsutum (strain FP-91666) TaxID=721885 RepID=UPI000440B193|nr:uncharacterized protein STEHIDRAFT_110377 [Stereum hirsutum FP-91666 SS1]EIM87069.1 hypothetical protein STEHIDRAFT_110377 [Stereum hirsutum FP-91666 SS1]